MRVSAAPHAGWASAVPIWPMDAPITAEGMRSKAFWPQGGEAQSMAFFNVPGMDLLYSGVTNRIAWAWWIASFTSKGYCCVARLID
ncbi:MAG: hypothetical protein QOC94_3245 [Actinoplanes sp.]|nr:hypothetical protein [Actinoplanes sp.]